MAIWSEIPEELVWLVAERLVCIDDLIRFGAVCKPWRSVSILEKEKKKAYAPLLMLAKADNDTLPSDINDGVGKRTFVIPYEGPNKMRSLDLELPMAQGRRCWGSPYGWLVTIGLDFNISLLNPLSGEQLPLPPQPVLQNQSLLTKNLPENLTPEEIISEYTRKFTLGWHQSSQRWLVMAIFGDDGEVAFAFTGNEPSSCSSSWTCIESTAETKDVILFEDQIYMVGYEGELSVCDIKEGTPPKAIQFAHPLKHLYGRDKFYLLEMNGRVYLVVRYLFSVNGGVDDPRSEHHYVTDDFAVFWFSLSEKKWYELSGLGKYALFLGNNTSFALSTTIYPDFSKNCVYFTDDHFRRYKNRFCDMGVSNYEEERVVDTLNKDNMSPYSKFSRPIFFMPTL